MTHDEVARLRIALAPRRTRREQALRWSVWAALALGTLAVWALLILGVRWLM